MRKLRLYTFCCLSLFIISHHAIRAQQVSLKNKKEAQKAFNMGITSIEEDSYWVALEYFSAALDYNPRFDMAYLTRGKVNLHLDNINEAIQDFTMAIEMNPVLGEAYFYRGYARLNDSPEEIVLSDLSAAIMNDYKESFVHYYRGLCKLLVDDFTGAILDSIKCIF